MRYKSRIIQISNIAPQTTKDQMSSLFGYLGKIEDVRLYPTIRDVAIPVQSRICFVKFQDRETISVSQHLTNTVFIDRALVVIPFPSTEMPDEKGAMDILHSNSAIPGLSTDATWPPHVTNHIDGIILKTVDPHLAENDLPAYPDLAATTESYKVNEIRRTAVFDNIHPSATPEEVLAFAERAGEVKYVRMGVEKDGTKNCLVEYAEQLFIVDALKLHDVEFKGLPLIVNHSMVAIMKPQTKSNEAARKEIEEAMTTVKEAQNSIFNAGMDPLALFEASTAKEKFSASQSRSRSPSRRSHSSRHTRSKSRSVRLKKRSRSCSHKKSRSPKRSSKKQSRSPHHSRSRKERSHSKRRSGSKSRSHRSPSKSKSRSSCKDKDRERRDRDKEKTKKSTKEEEKPKLEKEEEVKLEIVTEMVDGEFKKEGEVDVVKAENEKEECQTVKEEEKPQTKEKTSSKKSSRSKGHSRSRSRSKDKKTRRSRSRSHSRKRSKSRDKRTRKHRSRSKRRSRSHSKSRRNRSRDRRRSRSYEKRRRSRSSSRHRKVKGRDEKHPKMRTSHRDRSRSRDKREKERSRRDRDKERKEKKKDKREKEEKKDTGVMRNYDEEEEMYTEDKKKEVEKEETQPMEEETTEEAVDMDISNSP